MNIKLPSSGIVLSEETIVDALDKAGINLKGSRFKMERVSGVEVGVRKYAKGDYAPVFIQIPEKNNGDESGCGLIGGRSQILELHSVEELIKALRSAIDHVENYE